MSVQVRAGRWLLVTGLMVALGSAAASAQAPRPVAATWPLGLLIADSEVVYGPTLFEFDTGFIASTEGGYLARYTEAVDGEVLTGAQIVDRVAREYSVGPRLLLALVQMQSGWVTNPEPVERTFPLAEPLPGLRAGLSLAAGKLNEQYYAHRFQERRAIDLEAGASVEIPDTNSGSFAVLAYLSRGESVEAWPGLEPASRFYGAWAQLFGDPYYYLPTGTTPEAAPTLELGLPFSPGEMWFYVSGPRGVAGPGSPRAAIDFAPPPQERSDCVAAPSWVTAVAAGVVARSAGADVVVDTDGDGFEGSGWTHLYRHVSPIERVAEGTRVKAGDRLGHPSCDGGAAAPARMAFARRYNGEWIPVDHPDAPLILDGWAVLAGPETGTGWLVRPGAPTRIAGNEKLPGTNGIVVTPGEVVPGQP